MPTGRPSVAGRSDFSGAELVTTAAVLLVKDELDVVEYTLRHLATQVDEILVTDNASTDGTRELLAELHRHGVIAEVYDDPEVGYWQSSKMSLLGQRARERGHDWAVFADADERWQTEPDTRPIREHLLSLAPDIQVVNARLFHYIPSVKDSDDPDPFRRICWRLAEASSLPKVACRLREGLVVDAGNHGCAINGQRPRLVAGGLRVNHYSWRSESQFARKVTNGARAYAETDLPEGVGAHWRMWGDPYAEDLGERAAAHFRQHFLASDPPCAPGSTDPAGLFWDPAEGEE